MIMILSGATDLRPLQRAFSGGRREVLRYAQDDRAGPVCVQHRKVDALAYSLATQAELGTHAELRHCLRDIFLDRLGGGHIGVAAGKVTLAALGYAAAEQ